MVFEEAEDSAGADESEGNEVLDSNEPEEEEMLPEEEEGVEGIAVQLATIVVSCAGILSGLGSHPMKM